MPARSRTKAKKTVAPILVSIGRNAATIYPRPAERGRGPRWMLADYSTGKRRFQTFDTEREARDEAARLVARLNAMDADGASMTGRERAALVRATELVAPFNLDVPTACALFAEAAALVGHDVVVTACKAFAKRSPNARKPLPLRQAVEDLLESKDSKGRSPRLLSDIRSRLGRFVDDHPGRNLGDFSTAELQTWIDGLKGAKGTPLAAQTKRNFATLLHALFEHHRRRGSIADNPVKDLEREQVKRREDVAFWTPDEARALLDAIAPEARAALVVSLFGGLRSAEALRVTWQDVDLVAGHVVVAAGTAKTASRRLAPLSPNAVSWLRPLVGAPDDRLFDARPDRFAQLVTAACKRAGVRRIPNGARHTAATFKCALTSDAAKVAADLGNSPGIVHRFYRGLATQADAERFFSIVPQDGKGVLHAVA